MTAITAAAEIQSESLPGAPDKEWWDNFIKFDNERGRQLVTAVNSQRETALVDVDLVHGSITQRANPLSVPIAGIYAVRCFGVNVDATTQAPNGGFYSLGLPQLEWHPSLAANNSVLITATFPQSVPGSAGGVGEIIGSITRIRSNNVALTSNVTANVCTTTSLSLTTGNWLVSGMVGFKPAATTTIDFVDVAISKTSATLPATDTIAVPTAGELWLEQGYTGAAAPGTAELQVSLPPYPFTVVSGATTPLFLVARARFGVSTLGAYGSMYAIRSATLQTQTRGRVRLLFIGEQ